jgi:DNA-binding transcriptional MerR regulator
MKSQVKKYMIDELCTFVGMNKRTVRYYIQRGFVDRPEGTGKGAFYTSTHLQQLLSIHKWKNAGLSLERIEELLSIEKSMIQSGKPLPPPRLKKQGEIEVWSHQFIDNGVELHIEPNQAELSPDQVRNLFREVIKLYKTIKKES